jgi:3'-phosphoadenosine 5'-phosphosulfate synthase
VLCISVLTNFPQNHSLLYQKIISEEVSREVQELFIPDDQQEEYLKKAIKLEQLEVDTIDLQWIQVLSEGWATPLRVTFKSWHFCVQN